MVVIFLSAINLFILLISMINLLIRFGVWSFPYQLSPKFKSGKVQRKCVRFISFKCSVAGDLVYSRYVSFSSVLNLGTLEQRFVRMDLYLVYRLMEGLFWYFRSFIVLHILSYYTRSRNLFCLGIQVVNYAIDEICERDRNR